MKRLKELSLGCLLVVAVILFDNHIFREENKMRKALAWVVIVALLILVVRMVSAQAFQPIERRDECITIAVRWKPDTTMVESFGCGVVRGDTLVLVHHIVQGKAQAITVIHRRQVQAIVRLVPLQPP